MNKFIRSTFLVILSILLLFCLAACKDREAEAGEPLVIETVKVLPKAYINEEYDLWEVIVIEDGVEYSATACYVETVLDPVTLEYSFNEYTLDVTDLSFTPVTLHDTVVTITAKRGSQTVTKVITIDTIIRAEPLDDLYKSTGPLGWAETGFTKTVNMDSRYIKDDEAGTSLHVKFDGIEPHEWGQLIMELSNETAQRYFSDQIWDNAIVTFWVFNPMEHDIEFQLSVNDHSYPVMTDWTREEGHFRRQFAKAGEWTQIFFSLRRMGTTHKLVNNQYSTEQLNIKVQYSQFSTTTNYQFEFYLDHLDVVPASAYPDVDTTFTASNETLEQGWENIMQDTAWQGASTIYSYEQMMGEGSTCSLEASFDSEKGPGSPFVVLSPEMLLGTNYMPKLPDMTGGTLTAYFKFENASKSVDVDIIKAEGKDWKFSNSLSMELSSAGNGWYKGIIDVNDFDFGSGQNDGVVRIRFSFSGISTKSKVWIDTVKFDYEPAVKVREPIEKDWINLPVDEGMTSVKSTDYSTSYKKAEGSVKSLKFTAHSDKPGVMTLAPEFAVLEGKMDAVPNMTKGTVHAYFYFGEQAPEAALRLYNTQWKYSQDISFSFEDAGNGWYYGTIPAGLFQGYPEGDSSKVIRISILIPAGYTVYVDGLMHYPNEEQIVELNPDDVFASGIFTVQDAIGKLGSEITKEITNGSADAIHVWADAKTGWPLAGVSFAMPMDISPYTELSLDVKAQNAHRWFSIKLGYLDANNVEQFSEVGMDFAQYNWQTVKVQLSQFTGADLTKVTKVMICVNMEDSFHNDGRNEFWFDNLKLIKPQTTPENRGQLFKGGENLFFEIPNADYSSISFDYKLVTSGTMTLILRDNTWLKYFGDYVFDADGEFSDYAGISTEKLADGYIRVTMVMDELTRSGLADNRDNAPATINIFDIYTLTTADGYVDNVQGAVREEGLSKAFNPEDILASGNIVSDGFTGNTGCELTSNDNALYIWGDNRTGWPIAGVSFDEPVDISAYTDISVDIKALNAYKWFSIKIGYLDSNGVEQFSEIGKDFAQDDWQTIAIKLSQFAGLDLTKVTKFMICVNLETGFYNGVRNEFWVDNLKVTNQQSDPLEPGGMELSFQANTNAFLTFAEGAFSAVQFDYKLESSGEMYLILRDGTWLKYFGDYAFNADGEFSDYAGITTQKLSNGYIRVTMILSELQRSGCADNRDIAPATLAVFDVYGWTNVNGHIKNLQFLENIPVKMRTTKMQENLCWKPELIILPEEETDAE